ncbi:cytosolic phospholipase A2 beta-like [Meleagris gallopavo]|uniref:cytosolic phospholipase A2 beta-like n=1 Tax=Meleagris gallopavo TaxID=9103 RepID=UPI000549AD1E|nr:cytosolic phospholipase A2 beta-like [Meleagris gallopavo]
MGSPPAKMKICPIYMLSVRIIQARNIKSRDLWAVPLSCQNLAGHCYSLLGTSLKYLGLSGCSRRLQSSPDSSSERHQLGDFFSHRCQAPQMTASDCYVRLWLPSASNEKLQTKTIKNSDNPVWNETFYFRIQREVENILELAVCDEDPLTKDDMQFTVLFNIARVRPGERVREKFALKSEKERCIKKWESLEVEFWMEKM